MRNLFLLCFIMTLSLPALSQRYDISVGVDPVSAYHGKDSTAQYTDKLRQSTIQYYVKFGYILDNGLELRLGYKFGINQSHSGYDYINSTEVYVTTSKIMLHAVDASALKIIKYKFINFMAGGTFYYGYQPAYNNTDNNYGTPNGPYTITSYTGPRLQSWGFYINTSLYFRIYKFLYAGMDITNGFLLYNWIGNGTTSIQSYSANGTQQGAANNETNHYNDLTIEKSLLNVDIGLRFAFDTKKPTKAKLPVTSF